MIKWKLKEVRNVYRYVGTEEVELQEYNQGVVFPEFCLLWKDQKKINKKFIRELLKIKDEVEELDKKRLKENGHK